MLCKYWARFAHHVSPCVHRAFTDFSGWNVVGESGSLLVFLFWFDQLLSITDIGNYPQKRRGGRKKLAIIIFILSVMVFSYIEKKYCGELCNTASTDFTVPLTWVYFYIDFLICHRKFHVYTVVLLHLSLGSINPPSHPTLCTDLSLRFCAHSWYLNPGHHCPKHFLWSWWKYFISTLSNAIDNSHMWLLTTWNGASVIGNLNL